LSCLLFIHFYFNSFFGLFYLNIDFFKGWICSTIHKDIGIFYPLFSTFSCIIGLWLSIIIRLELSSSGFLTLIQTSLLYNVIVTFHVFITLFFMVMPLLICTFGNWSVPILLGSLDMAFSRLSTLSLWLFIPSLSLLYLSSFFTLVKTGLSDKYKSFIKIKIKNLSWIKKIYLFFNSVSIITCIDPQTAVFLIWFVKYPLALFVFGYLNDAETNTMVMQCYGFDYYFNPKKPFHF